MAEQTTIEARRTRCWLRAGEALDLVGNIRVVRVQGCRVLVEVVSISESMTIQKVDTPRGACNHKC